MAMLSTTVPMTPPRRAGGTAPAQPARPATRLRDLRLDVFRGLAMIIILFAHTPGNFFTLWIPARWGFSDATEMFVFCSGMASAVAFGATFERAGWGIGTARVAYRCWQVYWAHIGLFLVVAGLMVALNAAGPWERDYVAQLNLMPFFTDPMPEVLGLLTLTYVPNYFDILPMYLVILAMMPLVMLLARISLWLTAAVLGTLWLFAQTDLLAALGLSFPGLHLPAEPWSDRAWFFNPFGWQLIFFTGFALMAGWLPKPPVTRWLVAVALVIVLANVPLSNIGVREFGLDWARDWREANRLWFDKTDFGLLRYVQFLALAYLAWAAVGEGGARLMPGGAGLAARLRDRAVGLLTTIGRQSLAVFVFSMVLARLNGFWLDQWGREAAWHTVVVNLTGVALLVAVAHGVGWIKSQPWKAQR